MNPIVAIYKGRIDLLCDMTTGTPSDVAIPASTLRDIERVLGAHDVELGILFGSAARPDGDPSDLDLAISFADDRPSDDGYSSAYFDLLSDLESTLETGIDLVDVHSMKPRFARIVFEEGVLVVGSSERRDTLAESIGDETPSLEDAKDRIGAAASRLRERST